MPQTPAAALFPGRLGAVQPSASWVARSALLRYIARGDDTATWRDAGRLVTSEGSVTLLELSSQTWRGSRWRHDLRIYEPPFPSARHDVLPLLIAGGRVPEGPTSQEAMLGFRLARACRVRCAILRHVPNQPLFGGLAEDALIAETFVRTLTTGEDDWPLLFPMTKAALRAMDALHDWSRGTGQPIRRFVLAGGSKRGWTCWLAAALDERVAGLVPMVIDVLDANAQIAYQKTMWGRCSEMLADYERRGLLTGDESTGVPAVWRMVDPYTFRQWIRQPKRIVNGTNDRFWPLDALNLYWDGLIGPKQVAYVPNAGHADVMHLDATLAGIAALVRQVAENRPGPAVSWRHGDGPDGRPVLEITADLAPRAAQLWVARASHHSDDCRDHGWSPVPLEPLDGHRWLGIAPEALDAAALFGNLTYDLDGLTYHLSTTIRQVRPIGRG
jgi:PhoPQ-activated pathogenicity-related protein